MKTSHHTSIDNFQIQLMNQHTKKDLLKENYLKIPNNVYNLIDMVVAQNHEFNMYLCELYFFHNIKKRHFDIFFRNFAIQATK